jgi:hypothetical protein
MTDVWACGQCRSINQRRETRCYRCHTPRAVGGVDPLSLSVTDRKPVATGPVGTYHPTTGLALLTAILVIATVGVSLVSNVVAIESIEAQRLGEASSLTGEGIGTMTLVLISFVVLATLAWATWISRVVANLPALDLGFSLFTPRIVFFETLIPLYNIRRMHGVMKDVLGRYRPSARDQIAILAAWFPLALTLSIALFVNRVVLVLPEGTAIDVALLMREISLGLQIVSGLFLVALIWRVEGRMRRRAGEIRG